MRVLSAKEMDQIFGGDGTVVPTLPTTYVTANVYQNAFSPYVYGAQFGWDESAGGGGSSGCGSLNANAALSSLPSLPQLKCRLNAAAYQGGSLDPSYQIVMVNSYAYESPTGDLSLQRWQSSPGPNWIQLYGSTSSAGVPITYLYALGLTNSNEPSVPYQTPTGQSGSINGPFTASEWALLVLGHEAAHQRGINSEDVAEFYGAMAVTNFRNGAGANCTTSGSTGGGSSGGGTGGGGHGGGVTP